MRRLKLKEGLKCDSLRHSALQWRGLRAFGALREGNRRRHRLHAERDSGPVVELTAPAGAGAYSSPLVLLGHPLVFPTTAKARMLATQTRAFLAYLRRRITDDMPRSLGRISFSRYAARGAAATTTESRIDRERSSLWQILPSTTAFSSAQ